MSTIDPGIEETVKEAAEDVEIYSSERHVTREEEDLMAPSRWWFASTACPLLAATFGPIANGFSVCALVYSWREYLPGDTLEASGIALPDPYWLVAINAVSLACALVGNASLLLNMAKRLKFSTAQPITVTGFLLAGVLLVADMAALTSSSVYFITDPRAQPAANHALTGAFYYAVFAATIYILVGLLMVLTIFGANHGYYSKEFHLTNAQRTLMAQTMSFVIYLLLGALVFSHVEGWRYLDAVYWADVTLLTVGFGDYSPQTNLGRGLWFPFTVGGILMVGLVIGSIRSLVLERGKQKMGARITEKRRENAVHGVDEKNQTIKISWFARVDFCLSPDLSPAQRREEEFNVMRKVQAAAERERRYFQLATSLTSVMVLWLAGAAVFKVSENEQAWTYYEAVYFAWVSLLTIGYGDETPASNSGKAFFVIWSLLAVPALTILISDMGDTFVKTFSDTTTWIFTHLIPQKDMRDSAQATLRRAKDKVQNFHKTSREERMSADEHHQHALRTLSDRLESYIEEEELEELRKAEKEGDYLERDIHFYHFVLARELKRVQADMVSGSQPVEYTWNEWEFFLLLMGNGASEDENKFPGQRIEDVLAPAPVQNTASPFKAGGAFDRHNDDSSQEHGEDKPDTDGLVDRDMQRKDKWNTAPHKRGFRKRHTADPLGNWSWLDEASPLMSSKSESEWIADKLSAALVRELNRSRRGSRKKPPIGMGYIRTGK